MNENEQFSCNYKELKNYSPSANYKITDGKFNIESMISYSSYISQIFIKYAIEYNIPFLNEGVAILIDCSRYINKENKLFNMHLICGLTEGLNAIGIPYSVALISDDNFKRIIKKYDEPHDKYELQKIYECYMISRYRTNLAKSIKFGIDHLKFDKNMTDNGNSNTAYFIFTDGMDENLYFGKEFKDNLFNCKNLSFGFVFIKSSLLTDEQKLILQNLWNKFETDIKGCNSKTKIKPIENKFDIKVINSIIEMFVSTLIRDISEQNYKLDNYPIESPIFEIPNKYTFKSPESIKNTLNEDYSKQNEIIYNISQINYNKQKDDKIDLNLYKNIIGKVIECKENSNSLNKISSKFLIPKNKINISLLDQIFLPNKASSMILSTSGSEIDIPAFIKYLFENSPNPMIY